MARRFLPRGWPGAQWPGWLLRLWQWDKMSKQLKQRPSRLAERIADCLFGRNEPDKIFADRLKLVIDSKDGGPERDLGGWAYKAAMDQIQNILNDSSISDLERRQ